MNFQANIEGGTQAAEARAILPRGFYREKRRKRLRVQTHGDGSALPWRMRSLSKAVNPDRREARMSTTSTTSSFAASPTAVARLIYLPDFL